MNHSVVLWTYINYYSKYYSKSKSYCVYYCVLDIVYYYYDRHTYIEKKKERERHSSPPLKIKTIKKSCNIPFFSFPSTVISYFSCFTLSLFRKCYWIIIIPPPWKKNCLSNCWPTIFSTHYHPTAIVSTISSTPLEESFFYSTLLFYAVFGLIYMENPTHPTQVRWRLANDFSALLSSCKPTAVYLINRK